MLPRTHLVLASLVVFVQCSNTNFRCKNGTSDWPLPCRSPSGGYKLRFNGLPISAWWGPSGYAHPTGNDSNAEFDAYAAAHFNVVMISDRLRDRCQGPNASAESWDYIMQNIAHAEAKGMQVLLDSYRCTPWGETSQNIGGESQGAVAAYVPPGSNHKITLPEIKWVASRLKNRSSVVGILITDDGVDLAKNEIDEIAWMRENTPELLPWVNQCGMRTVCNQYAISMHSLCAQFALSRCSVCAQ
jgi:hypothetical protein